MLPLVRVLLGFSLERLGHHLLFLMDLLELAMSRRPSSSDDPADWWGLSLLVLLCIVDHYVVVARSHILSVGLRCSVSVGAGADGYTQRSVGVAALALPNSFDRAERIEHVHRHRIHRRPQHNCLLWGFRGRPFLHLSAVLCRSLWPCHLRLATLLLKSIYAVRRWIGQRLVPSVEVLSIHTLGIGSRQEPRITEELTLALSICLVWAVEDRGALGMHSCIVDRLELMLVNVRQVAVAGELQLWFYVW